MVAIKKVAIKKDEVRGTRGTRSYSLGEIKNSKSNFGLPLPSFCQYTLPSTYSSLIGFSPSSNCISSTLFNNTHGELVFFTPLIGHKELIERRQTEIYFLPVLQFPQPPLSKLHRPVQPCRTYRGRRCSCFPNCFPLP